MTQAQHTPEIGLFFEDKNGEPWTITRHDINGVFWAGHGREYSCSTMQVTPEKISRVLAKHHNVPYLVARNAEYNAYAIAKARGQ